jgi:hypothetical protein
VISSCERVSTALEKVDAAIQQAVQSQPQVNVDETGWPTETRKGWLTQRVPGGRQRHRHLFSHLHGPGPG